MTQKINPFSRAKFVNPIGAKIARIIIETNLITGEASASCNISLPGITIADILIQAASGMLKETARAGSMLIGNNKTFEGAEAIHGSEAIPAPGPVENTGEKEGADESNEKDKDSDRGDLTGGNSGSGGNAGGNEPGGN